MLDGRQSAATRPTQSRFFDMYFAACNLRNAPWQNYLNGLQANTRLSLLQFVLLVYLFHPKGFAL
jgi:hypothetical protein